MALKPRDCLVAPMAGGRTTELPSWAAIVLSIAVLGAILFGAAVAGGLAVPVWLGWVLAAWAFVSLIAAGYALAVRAR